MERNELIINHLSSIIIARTKNKTKYRVGLAHCLFHRWLKYTHFYNVILLVYTCTNIMCCSLRQRIIRPHSSYRYVVPYCCSLSSARFLALSFA